MSTEDKKIEMLERRANVIRSRLLRTVDALDTRRHQVTDVVDEVVAVAPLVGVSFLGIVAVAAGSVLSIRHYVKKRHQRVLAVRVRDFLENLRLQPKQPSFFARMGQKLVMTAVTVTATEVMRRLAKNTIDGRLPDGRLVVGRELGEGV